MSKSRDRVLQALNHQNTDYVPVDFGSTAVTGIHCRIVEALRNHYGLESKPVKLVERKIYLIWILHNFTNSSLRGDSAY